MLPGGRDTRTRVRPAPIRFPAHPASYPGFAADILTAARRRVCRRFRTGSPGQTPRPDTSKCLPQTPRGEAYHDGVDGVADHAIDADALLDDLDIDQRR